MSDCWQDARLLAASLLLALAGCGGGANVVPSGHTIVAPSATAAATVGRREVDREARGGDVAVGNPSSGAPEAPALELAVDGRQLRFSWTVGGTATHYKLFANPDGASGLTQAGGPLAADSSGTALGLAARHDWDRARYLLEACNDAGCTASNPVSTFTARPQAATPAHGKQARVDQPAAAAAAANTAAGRVCIHCPIQR